MIVVSNTSPLTNLAAIGRLDLVHALWAELHIPEGVWDELNAGGIARPGRDEVATANWISRHRAENQSVVAVLRRDLDQGEAEAIALAMEMGADIVLLDEKEGRHVAQRLGLNVVGVIGILLDAKSKGLVQSVRPHLDALRQNAGFYLSDSLYRSALRLANEA